MGLDGRDYMKEERPYSVRGAWAGLRVSHQLIVVNVVVFLAWQLAPPWFMADQFTVSWEGVFGRGLVWTLFTSAFSHAGFWHLLWNMVFLHWFGPALEDIYGRRNFLVLYLYGALVASLAHMGYEQVWGQGAPMLGASGAVMAVVVVTAIFYPRRTILFMFLIPMPLWLLAAIKLGGDLLGVMGSGSGVSHAAHLGGAVAGLAFKLLDLRLFSSPGEPERGRGLLSRLSLKWRARHLRFVPPEPEPPKVDADTNRRVDELLRKIHAEGMDSLTEEERAFLDGASSKYKK